MRVKSVLVLILILVCQKLPAPDAAGHGGGCRGYKEPKEANASEGPWFTGKSKTIRFCFSVSEGFSSRIGELEKWVPFIQNRFDGWKKYLEELLLQSQR